MSFSTLIFTAAFLPLFLAVYFLAPGIRNKNRVLLLFSLLFYSFAGLGCLLLLLALGVLSWYIGREIEKAIAAEEAVLLPEKDGKLPKKIVPGKKARHWLQGGIVVLLLVLIFFKYTGLLLGTLRLPAPKLLLPLGISFYIFRLISYLADVYKKRIPAQPLFETLLYTVNFQVIGQGPIVGFPALAEQFAHRQHSLDGFLLGLGRFLVGLAKKCLLADHLGELCESFLPLGFLTGGDATVLGAWLGGLCYMLQLYLDFAAYSDMALGLGQICGFDYPENFNYPYVATSIRDFWRRWHISLSSFFRDYVYIPLGGNRVSFGRLCLNLLVVWSLTGIWHGASWSFLLWGWYYFLLILLENLLQKSPAGLREMTAKVPRPFRHCLTLLLVYFGWVLFRFSDFTSLKGALLLMLGQGDNAFDSAQVNLLLKNNLFFLLLSLTAVTPLWKLLSDTFRNAAMRRIQLRLRNRAKGSKVSDDVLGPLDKEGFARGKAFDTLAAKASNGCPQAKLALDPLDKEGFARGKASDTLAAKASNGRPQAKLALGPLDTDHAQVLGRVKAQVQKQLRTAWLWEIGYYSLRTIWLLLLLLLSVMAMVGSSYQPFLYNAF